MAFPNKKQKPTGTPVPGQKSYAAAVRPRITTTSHSLMHGEVGTERNGTPTESATPSTKRKLKTRIWRNARTNDGYFLDISKIAHTTEQQHLQTLDQQYKASNFLGIKFLGKNTQRYIEVYPTKDIVDRFIAEGVMYESENSKIQLFPCKAVDGEGKLIQISLTDIPFLPQAQLLQELSTAIGVCGKILDIGLNYEQSMGWFMGSGYAIIQQFPNVTYPQLHHTITWQTATNDEEFCHATFPDMATWCRYCHDEGHTKFECPKALARIICYNCDNAGHRQDACTKPKKGSSDREFKKARKTPPNISSAEADKSKWAPSNTKNSDDGKQHPKGQQTQQPTAQHDSKSLDTTPTDLTQPLQSRDSSGKSGRSNDNNNSSKVITMSDDEGDDEDYQPTASDSEVESDSEAEHTTEEMSDVETTGDEVANLMNDQQQPLSQFNMNFVNGDNNLNTINQNTSSENHNDSTAHHQNLL